MPMVAMWAIATGVVAVVDQAGHRQGLLQGWSLARLRLSLALPFLPSLCLVLLSSMKKPMTTKMFKDRGRSAGGLAMKAAV